MRRAQRNAAAHIARRFVFAMLLSGMALAALPATAQQFTPRDEKPEDYPAGAGRDDTLCLHRLPRFQADRAAGPEPLAMDDTLSFMTTNTVCRR